MNWLVRAFEELTPRELHDLLRLRTDVFVVEQHCAYPEIDGKDTHSTHLLGYHGSELGAYSRWYDDGPVVVLGRIVVRSDLRGRGEGRRLVEHVFGLVGDRPIRISAQKHLERYYEGIGFETTSEPYDDFGIPHVDMLRAAPPRRG